MKKILIIIIAVALIGAVLVPIATATVTHRMKGAWGLEGNDEPFGRVNGKIINNNYFVGKAFKDGTGHLIGLNLHGGTFNGFLNVRGCYIPIDGEYTITNGYVTAIWHCHGYNGWIIGKLI